MVRATSAFVRSTSPDATYGSAACEGFYVVEATWTYGKDIRMSAEFHNDQHTLPELCGASTIDAKFYGFVPGNRATGVFAHWETIDVVVEGGYSYSGGCSVYVEKEIDNSKYTKIRVAGKATAWSGLPARVTATIEIPLDPA